MSAASAAPVLEVRGLTMDFGGVRAVDGVDLAVAPREIVALIGPNGAGKTTVFNCVTGMCVPTAGEIRAARPGCPPRPIAGLRPSAVTAGGIARTFQNIRLFPTMTALENVMIGRHCRTRAGVLGAVLRGRAVRREEAETAEAGYALLERLGLARHANDPAGSLPYGVQRRLEIARALATEPFLLLLDEPAAGMNPPETRELDELIRRIRGELGLAVLLIEHDMKLVMSVAERILVMDHGSLLAAGSPGEIRANPEVVAAYLGEGGEA